MRCCGPGWGSWDWTCRSQKSQGLLFDHALFAVSAAYIGQWRSDQAMVSQACAAYSIILQKMREGILSSDVLAKDVLLRACMAFQAYDVRPEIRCIELHADFAQVFQYTSGLYHLGQPISKDLCQSWSLVAGTHRALEYVKHRHQSDTENGCKSMSLRPQVLEGLT